MAQMLAISVVGEAVLAVLPLVEKEAIIALMLLEVCPH